MTKQIPSAFDQIANDHGKWTTLGWWKTIDKETRKLQEQGEDYREFLDERINGLMAIRQWVGAGRPQDAPPARTKQEGLQWGPEWNTKAPAPGLYSQPLSDHAAAYQPEYYSHRVVVPRTWPEPIQAEETEETEVKRRMDDYRAAAGLTVPGVGIEPACGGSGTEL